MPFDGSCHCGAVTFTVDAELPETAISCNCSICRRKGSLLSFFPASVFTLKSGEDDLLGYTFHAHLIEHLFCTTCGIHPFAKATGPDGVDTRAINMRCVPTCDLDALTVQKYDGASK